MGDTPPRAASPGLPEEMSFLDHLEEFRWRILKGLMGIGIGVIVAFFFSDFIMDKVLLGPAKGDFFMYQLVGINAGDLDLQNRRLPGQFFTYWGTLLVVGFIIGVPAFFYQLWAFIAPALEPGERKGTRFVVFNITMLFIMGVAFGYLILTPFAVQFFSNFQISESVRNDIDINAYFSALTLWSLSSGLIFQLPMVSYILSKIGLLTPELLRKHRKWAIIVCFILAAFLTPPDPISQLIIAFPLLLLYQLGIYISKVVNRKRDREIFGAEGRPE
ncbi:twin-arginine translocase subunit TatC [Natronogracilivirgula saccharolytica]|uniref:Sec-independent protein translocase protein TatC n=2 Tax=Natronogracilivirga saccharolytica TaxID=2812953 RepID=A0A8J7UWL4_9BACT|nr:twin-arginine translocase subunit TatC [Natronogracilivirga saccharolytica]